MAPILKQVSLLLFAILFALIIKALLIATRKEVFMIALQRKAVNITTAGRHSTLLEDEISQWLEAVKSLPEIPDKFFDSKDVILEPLQNATMFLHKTMALKHSLKNRFHSLCTISMGLVTFPDTSRPYQRNCEFCWAGVLMSLPPDAIAVSYAQTMHPLLEVAIHDAHTLARYTRSSRIAVSLTATTLQNTVKAKKLVIVNNLSSTPLHDMLAQDRIVNFLDYLQMDFNAAIIALRVQSSWIEETAHFLDMLQKGVIIYHSIRGVQRISDVVCALSISDQEELIESGVV